MKLSFRWLNHYIELHDVSIGELAHKITMSICEIEDIHKVFEFDPNLVIGKVLEVSPHPDSHQLKICKVDIGSDVLQIVSGAENLEKNQHVVVAKIGAKLKADKDNEKEELKIEKRTIKNVDSFGMICSTKELQLDNLFGFNGGVWILDELEEDVWDFIHKAKAKKSKKQIPEGKKKNIKNKKFTLGTPLREFLPIEDTVLEIDNKSITHRPDLWGHFGFALELSALLGRKIKYDVVNKTKEESKKLSYNKKLPQKKILIQNESALAYNGVVCSDVRVEKSPFWMRLLLTSIDQKSINNIVDISNFVMYELGQPNHAFDLDEIKSDTIRCDFNKKEFLFTALDKETYTIPKNSIVIYDEDRPIALGGIIGGYETSIQEKTKNIFIESATFPREHIRKTISALSIRTESARRFEKGQDPAKSKLGIERFLILLKQQQPQVKIGKIQSYPKKLKIQENKIQTTISFIQKRLGFSISKNKVKEILNRLNFKIEEVDKDTIKITVPSYRSYYDITIPEDIVEEIGRLYGYDNIEPVAPRVEIQKPKLPHQRYFERQVKFFLSQSGSFYETMNYSFASKEDNLQFGYEGIQLKNPAQKQKDRMRVSLIPGLLEQLKLNIHRFEEAGLYELGRVFLPEEKEKKTKQNSNKLPLEKQKLTLVYFTERLQDYKNYFKSSDDERIGIFYYVREIIEKMFKYFYIDYEIKENTKHFLYHPNCQVEFYRFDQSLGSLGILHPDLYMKYEFPLSKVIILGDLDFDGLYAIWNEKRSKKETTYKPPSQFPKSTFDFTILLEKRESTYTPIEHIQTLKFPEIQKIEVLEIYTGAPIPEGKKSVSYRVHCLDYQSIPSERIQTMLDSIVKLLEKKGFPLRV
ncbi:MAG: phenylalanine--tRNA ligase subunit beta [Leptospiraceae bacterium]|nr:phenylalanine--tRNA ligase subunit beta [Leptospiraceae bacterium]MDW7975661.1 phenylalanine--tRNA ligase subunit beta [Leptospiraceae bacterium]